MMLKKQHRWTEDQINALTELYPETPTQDIAFILKLSLSSINAKARRLALKKSSNYLNNQKGSEKTQFKNGHIAWNKGLKGVTNAPAYAKFQFGHKANNHKPVGSIRKSIKGYLEIKVAEGIKQWKPLHHKTWFDHHGEYPKKGFILTFKDGDKENVDIDNLELLSKADIMKQNTMHNFPEELKDVIRLTAKLKRKINEQPIDN